MGKGVLVLVDVGGSGMLVGVSGGGGGLVGGGGGLVGGGSGGTAVVASGSTGVFGAKPVGMGIAIGSSDMVGSTNPIGSVSGTTVAVAGTGIVAVGDEPCTMAAGASVGSVTTPAGAVLDGLSPV